MSCHIDDRALLQDFIRTRSDAAFGAIVQTYIPLVYNTALRQVRQEHLAEDVTQAVFMLLAQKARGFSDGVYLPAWLHTATRYASANALRTENRRRKFESEAARMKSTSTLPDADWNQLSPALDNALSRLPRKDRELLLMRYFESLDTTEMATRMGISEGTARKRLSRAMDRLRETLNRRGVNASNLTLSGLMARHFAPPVPAHLIQTATSGALSGASKASALAAATASSMAIAKMTIIGSMAALIGVMVGSAALIYSITNRPTAATAPAGNPIKLGWMVSQWTADEHLYDPPGTYDCVTAIRARFNDPQIEFFAIVEPGTENADSMRPILRQYFRPGHVINGADPSALSNLDVIVLSRDWNMRPSVMSAILKAVRNGTGLFRHTSAGVFKNDGDDSDVAEINCTDRPQSFINKFMPPVECRVVSIHPILAGIDKNVLDSPFEIPVLNGCSGIVHGIPLVAAATVLNGPDGSPQPATAPSDQPAFVPMFVSQIGKGKVVACQWDSIPKPLFDATNGRFYIHCVQWLAGRPIQ